MQKKFKNFKNFKNLHCLKDSVKSLNHHNFVNMIKNENKKVEFHFDQYNAAL